VSEPFKGTINVDIRDSEPDWAPFGPPRAPDGAPNVVYIVLDDVGFSAMSCEFIKDAKAVAPDKPFFLYYAPGAAHAPHHAPQEWIERYAGRFDLGYEALREQSLARQKQLGIVPPDTELPPLNPIGTPQTRTGPDGQPFPPLDYTKPWDSL
jgi:arylsulfatase